MATIDGKQIANMLYHAGIETLLTIGYAEIGRKLLRRPPPKVDFNMGMLGCCLWIYYWLWQPEICRLNRYNPCRHYEINCFIYFFSK